MKSTQPPGANPRPFLRRVFSAENLTGDVRSAVIGSVTGAVIGAITTIATTLFFTHVPLQYTVFVNDDGYAQPKGLFDLAEKNDPKLSLSFNPAELRNVYVCEYKLVTGDDWKKLVLSYLDTYRECFDVNARSEDNFIISANTRASLLVKKDTNYLCKCAHG